jgi:hypothetical protein
MRTKSNFLSKCVKKKCPCSHYHYKDIGEKFQEKYAKKYDWRVQPWDAGRSRGQETIGVNFSAWSWGRESLHILQLPEEPVRRSIVRKTEESFASIIGYQRDQRDFQSSLFITQFVYPDIQFNSP